MQIPHLYSQKWCQTIVFMLILYACIKIWFFDRKETKLDPRFSSLEHLKLWTKYNTKSVIDVLDILPNCGIPYPCPDDTFSLHVYTGHQNHDQSKLCIMGKYLTNHASNNGRGLNIVLINSKRLEIEYFVTFDVYMDNSIVMDTWINSSVTVDDIVLVYTYDEASRMLAESSKKLFYDYGSSKIQDLHFRSQWFMITRKGIQGFTPFEKVTMAHNGNWVIPVKVSPPMLPNAKCLEREKFCKEHVEMKHSYFCAGMKKYDDITPAPLIDQSLIGNIVFNVPIAIIVANNMGDMEQIDSLSMTLESLIKQPGVNPANVYVYFNRVQPLVLEMAKLFKFHTISVDIGPNDSYTDVTCANNYKITETAVKTLGRKERYVMVIHNGLILAPDFLYFMSQLVTVADVDQSIMGISAWNINGYKMLSQDVQMVYRVQDPPSLGILVRSDICLKRCKLNIAHSCLNVSTSTALKINTASDEIHILVPDVSRVLVRPYPDLIKKRRHDYWHEIITAERNTNILPRVTLNHPDVLINATYFQHVSDLLKTCIILSFSEDEIKSCRRNNSFPLQLVSKFERRSFAVYYNEIDDSHETTLKSLTNCFGIYSDRRYKLSGSYYGVFRFTIHKNNLLLVKQGSPFYTFKQ